MTIENILRKHITRETHKDSHARVVVHLAVDIRAEICRELEEGMPEKVEKECKFPGKNHYDECADCIDKSSYNSARSRALKIVKGEDL